MLTGVKMHKAVKAWSILKMKMTHGKTKIKGGDEDKRGAGRRERYEKSGNRTLPNKKEILQKR